MIEGLVFHQETRQVRIGKDPLVCAHFLGLLGFWLMLLFDFPISLTTLIHPLLKDRLTQRTEDCK